MKYMSVITNFGCHYKCPYCIVKENNLHIPRTTLSGLDNLEEALKENNCDIVSISGGGDPLHEYEKHIDWYRKFFGIAHKRNVFFNGSMRPIPVEMHTSYMTDETAFPFYDCYRVVYHANSIDQLSHIRRTGNEIVRAVFVVTADYTKIVLKVVLFGVLIINQLPEAQLVNLCAVFHEQGNVHDVSDGVGHKKLWWYIEQNDYNLYYAENEVSGRYRDFEKEVL